MLVTKQARINAVLAAQRKRDRSKAAADKAVKDLRERVREAVDDGVRLVDLAEAMGVSVTRVSQLKRGTSS
ncbi:Uncharacterised protein [Mycobacteroides abscessus subsp. abscessus]|nr:Uncharacterised protein [Mycobacteroides abscessus subsp. abscessus]SLC96245.1 Uncharacterised protein [Mycobacteroides abscessus subsp. massiliense]SLF13087.1 Uncharacterised protein [Mycobacteroides abscessus subsp. massiliense]SLF27217.1 Uncharacterised protein [Mycobacteroides abscessus subsp. massiliense]